MSSIDSYQKKDINKIVIIRSKTIKEFEEKIIESSKKYNIVKTDFGSTKDYFWLRMYCT
jgi:hypothetical protein